MRKDFIDKYIQYYLDLVREYDNIDFNFNIRTIKEKLDFMKISNESEIINKLLSTTLNTTAKRRLLNNEGISDVDLQKLLLKNETLHEQLTNPENCKLVDELFERYYNENFHILWGYYSVLDADSKAILYYLSKDFKKDNKEVHFSEAYWRFTYIPIPSKLSENSLNEITELIARDGKRFLNKKFDETPDTYRANSWIKEPNKLKEIFTNTYLQRLNDSSSFNLILGEEVLFFLYGHLYFSNPKSKDFGKTLYLNKIYESDEFNIPSYPHLKQLCKYALSVESLILYEEKSKPFHEWFNLSEYYADWGEKEELFLRKKVDSFINFKLNALSIEEILEKIHDMIVPILELFISKIKNFIYKIERNEIRDELIEFSNCTNDKLIELVARFNMKASLLVLNHTPNNTLHDIFMFPMVKSGKEKIETRNLAYEDCLKQEGKPVYINIPVIMTTYITTLYGINGVLDEDESSLNGFNITMEACKSLAKPIVESEFYGRLIRSKLLPQAIRAAISQVITRTTSHNTGSHILANNLETESADNLSAFKVYLRQRMLFNADLASNSIKFFSPILFTEITESFRRLKIVTKYISGIEGRSFSSFDVINNGLIVSLPNGTLGFQAMYILFENLIRNYFKHGKGSGKLFDKENNELKLSLLRIEYDNPYFYCFEISDGTVIDDIEVFERIKKLIDEPILDNSYKLRYQGLGYLEIKAVLCYLNDIPLDQVDNPVIKNDTYKKVFEVMPLTNENNTLRYHFLLPKPFFIKLSNSNSLDKSSLEKGIVDSKFPTEFDSQCLYFYGDPIIKQLSNSSLTPRIVDSSHCPKSFKDIHFLIDEFYNYWLKDINDYPNFSCYNLDGKKTDIKYYEIVFNQTYVSVERNELLSNRYSIFFDNHGYRVDYILSNKQSLGVFFYEDYGDENYTGKKIRNIEFEKPYILNQIFEASKVKIIIIDERIQRYATQPYKKFNQYCSNDNILLAEILELSNILIPTIENTNIDLNSENFENSLKSEIKLYCEKWLKSEKLDFLIIHLGVLEKFTSDKSSESIHKVIQEVKPNNMENSHLIIISERGTPDNIREDYRFLHFSNVSKYIIEERSKMGLVNAIFNSRSLKNQTHNNDNYNNFHKA